MSRRLSTQDHCRQALAWLWREVESDRMDVQKARTLCHICLSLSGILSDHDIEARIVQLETAMSRRGAA